MLRSPIAGAPHPGGDANYRGDANYKGIRSTVAATYQNSTLLALAKMNLRLVFADGNAEIRT